MSSDKQPITAVPTNIITGFLGVGKTSAILNLLKNKPSNERWAVLVNEFGEIGVDGSLFEGQHTNKQGVFIREVPGGCMCCTAGLPMQIALNQLLSEARPDRLLIEPTGLGHPKEVLQVLTTDYYREILNLQKTITLVDARKLADSEYAEHDTFIQQVAIADTVVGNKVDLYSQGELESLTSFVAQHGQPETPVLATEQGKIEFTELEGESRWLGAPAHHHHHHKSKPLACELPIPESGFIKANNQGEGFQSEGWRFAPDKVFSHSKIKALLGTIDAERIKAVFITYDGIFGYNITQDAMTELELDDCSESRIEVIAKEVRETLEAELLDCLS
ncbi:putative metal chaperone [Vibrio ishigakensis]|uniref:Putative metal chaperone n=1 Tax=Vibrio ishigakensis TaxID=1481914 RepID=A0A0B8PAZ1_9VIBR|nr:putative metal chaperone [Vibrio ishigakensis]